MKTVRQLADAHHVSKQTIHRIVRKNALETIADGNRVLIPDDSEKAIIEALEALQGECGRSRMNADETRTAADVPEHSRTIQADDQSEELRAATEELCRLTEQNKALTEQLEELRADKAFLKEQLTVKDEQIRELTAALRAAQVLHGADKQQQQKVIEVTETKTAGSGQQDPVQRPAHHPRKTERQQQPSMMRKIIQGLKNRLT